MPDYRDRPPVDQPRRTVLSVFRSVLITDILAAAVFWIALVGFGFAAAVEAGLASW